MVLCLFCVLEYFIRITNQKYNKKKRNKENFQIPKDSKREIMR